MSRIDKNVHIHRHYSQDRNEVDRGIKKIQIAFRKIRRIVVREKDETIIAAKILKKYLKGGKLSKKEMVFLKGQAKDIARILPIVATSIAPVPIPLTPMLLILGKKIGVDLVPKDQSTPIGYEPKVKKRKLRLLFKNIFKK